jgi:hypothetical protein
MSEKPATVDFGAPEAFGAHVFRVEIPAARLGKVLIVEDYGYRGSQDGIPRDEERVVLERRVWSQIAEVARREFNHRLKAADSRPAAGTPERTWSSACLAASSACWPGRPRKPQTKSCP